MKSFFYKTKNILSVFATVMFLQYPAFAKDLSVSFIDIGQGDSELIELPEGKNILIDAGDKDAGDKLISYLKKT
jgi:beta-lactamase superfamily II metal-dependent hydrolase